MMRIENKEVLRLQNRELVDFLESVNKADSSCFQAFLESSKSGLVTLKAQFQHATKYIHSKYDPLKEAELFVSKLELEEAKHILFIGAGLGYHIQAFVKRYPGVKFSIYEPNVQILDLFLENFNLGSTEMKNFQRLFTGTDSSEVATHVDKLLQLSNGMLMSVALPVYEIEYSKQVKEIAETIIQTLKNKRMYLAVNLVNQKRWTINSIKNFSKVASTPNIMYDFPERDFARKPAIIVAAGPSLTEEIENLKIVKEQQSAYIFSVGSAINTLLESGIYPDAAFAYDPSAEQWKVLQKVKDLKIKTIPLIFGSSIGFEALENYEGPTIHMITSPDTVSPQLLDTTKSIDVVDDSPTIAAITFQVVSKLKCNPIILVGQNLAYRNEKRYASGITYDFIHSDLSEEEIAESLIIDDVYGNPIQTNESFTIMRNQLEYYIHKHSETEVINTTKSGASIKGTVFKDLATVLKERLTADVIEPDWWKRESSYDIRFISKRIEIISREMRRIPRQLENLNHNLQIIENNLKRNLVTKMESDFAEFDKKFLKLKRNSFYLGFIEPMLNVQNERLAQEISEIRFENDSLKKAKVITKLFTQFFTEVAAHYEFVLPYFEEMKDNVAQILEKDVINE